MMRGQQTELDRRLQWSWWIGIAIAFAIVLWGEWERIAASTSNVLLWLFDMNVDSTPYALMLLVLPVCWCIRQPILSHVPRRFGQWQQWLQSGPQQRTSEPSSRQSIRNERCRALLMAGCVAGLAYWNCQRLAAISIGSQNDEYGKLPPAFHDEFSYLFQAETIGTGAWSAPSHPTAARLFDQMHVLNEGRFASRYFPGTGLWLTFGLRCGIAPLTMMHLAVAIVAALMFACGRELSNQGVGLMAGVLTALSPGMGLFGNLILAHLPTLMGLGVFWWAFWKWQRLNHVSDRSFNECWVLVAGLGLTWAMLCRPMTAAGIGLPFGLWLWQWMWRRRNTERRIVLKVFSGFAVPLLLGLGLLAWQNASITGSFLKTPYGLYAELFTPRHMYGFNNVVRAEALLTPRVLDHYDRWAENLTLELAVKNVGWRWLASWLWTTGLVVSALSVVVFTARHFIGTASDDASKRWRFVLWSIVSLHVAHVPYWYDGIFHWHYVFESCPLLCLLIAEATGLLLAWFARERRSWMRVWWSVMLVISVTINQWAVAPFWPMARVEAGLQELGFAKLKHAEFRRSMETAISVRPAIVLVKHDPSDRHIDYVTNSPTLDSAILIGRMPAAGLTETETIRLAQQAFPDRSLYVWDIVRRRVQRLR